jgi:hypothetical protein
VVPGCLIIRPSSTINITLQGTCKHYIFWTSSFRQREQKGNTSVEEASLLRIISSNLVHLAHTLDRSYLPSQKEHAGTLRLSKDRLLPFAFKTSTFQGYFKLLYSTPPRAPVKITAGAAEEDPLSSRPCHVKFRSEGSWPLCIVDLSSSQQCVAFLGLQPDSGSQDQILFTPLYLTARALHLH